MFARCELWRLNYSLYALQIGVSHRIALLCALLKHLQVTDRHCVH